MGSREGMAFPDPTKKVTSTVGSHRDNVMDLHPPPPKQLDPLCKIIIIIKKLELLSVRPPPPEGMVSPEPTWKISQVL